MNDKEHDAQEAGQETHDPGTPEAPTGVPAGDREPEQVPEAEVEEIDEQPQGSSEPPEAVGKPHGGAADDTERTPEAPGTSP